MRSLVAYRMLAHDRASTAGSVLGVVAILFLVGQQLSTLFGLFTYMSVLVDHSDADIWICGKFTDNANSTGQLPVRYADRISGLPEIEWAEPVITTAGETRRKDGKSEGVVVVGLPAPRFTGGPWAFERGSVETLLDYDGITVDNRDLELFGNPELGDILEINKKRVRVNAITKKITSFGGTLVFTNRTKAREISGLPPDRCSYILVKLKPGADVDANVARLRALLPRAEVFPKDTLSRLTRSYYLINTGIGFSFGFTTLMSSLVGIVIITLTMYTSILNREKDFAVLRALGGRKRDIFVIVLYQAIMIGAVGIFLGFLLLAFFLNGTRDSNLASFMPLWFPFVHAGFTLTLCLVGSLFAIRRATRVEPATAFR
jgi:putative ABC transport system permease protein